MLDHADPVHIGLAVVFCVLALWSVFTAAVMLYAIATDRGEAGDATLQASK